jgi:hypothetical protein
MSIPGQVLQQVIGAAERRFGVDDPIFLVQRLQAAEKRLPAGQIRELACEDEFSGAEQSHEPVKELAPEHDRQHRNRHEKVGSRADPARLVRRDSSARNYAMHVGVMQQVLPPGVQNAEKADGGSQMFGVRGDFQQGIRTGLQQQTVDLLFVLQGERGQFMRQGKYDVEVAYWQDFRLPFGDPPVAGCGLALRAVAIAAGVIGDGLMPALGALVALHQSFQCDAGLGNLRQRGSRVLEMA